MATTQNTFTGNGSTTTFAFTFPYIEESDVKVSLDAVDQTTGFSVDTTNIVFDTAPANNVKIRIYRDTGIEKAAATFFSGSAIRAQDLNDNVNQNLYVNQELRNRTALTTGSTITGDYVFVNADIQFEGSTDDDHETTLTVTDPTADRTIKLPNQSGTVPVLAADSNTAITATPEELNILDGVTATTAELNIMDGVTATTSELNIMDGVTASTAELNIMDGVTATTGELNILDGVTATTAELNLMDGVTATTAELNHVDGVTSNVQTQLDAKQPLDSELTELATMGSNTAAALADLTQAEVQILDGATLSTAELNFVDGVTSSIQSQIDGKQTADAELTELATMASTTASALADLTQAEVEILDGATVTTAELNILDGVTASTAELNLLDGVTATTAELNKLDGVTASTTELNALDGITSTVTELNLLDGVTSTTSELNILDGVTATTAELNQLDGNTLQSSSTTWTSNAQYPSAAQIDARITARIDPIGGFEAIADEDSFPATAPPEGTVISIANAGGMVIPAAATCTDATRAGGSDTVTIQNIPSNMQDQTIQDGLGMLVIATSTAHTYDFHRVVATNADVTQLSSDIDDFKARYRVGSTNPTTSLDEGDLFYNTGSDKMLVYDGSAWEEVQSIGEYFIIPATELADFASGSASTEVISNAPANASQIILSINGVIQEPNSGTSAPTDGFALDGSTIRLAATPAANSEVWGVIIGSTVNIGTPSAGTVGTTQLADDGVTQAKIADDAVGADQLANTAVTAGSYTLSSITVDAQGRITAASSGTAGDSDKIEEGNTAVEVVDTGSDGHITFDTEGSEKARFDTNGRLLIGYNANTTPAGYDHKVQITGTNGNTSSLSLTSNAGSSVHNEPSITFGKTRGSSGGASNKIVSGDTIGTIQFAAGDDTDVASIAANIKCSADGPVSGNDTPGRLVFSTTADNAATPTERMRITNAGRVGIGSTNPNATLQVTGPDTSARGQLTLAGSSGGTGVNARLTFYRANDFIGHVSGNSDHLDISTESGHHIEFSPAGSEVMRITSGGNVGINSNDPQARLHVYKDTNGEYMRVGSSHVDRMLRFTSSQTTNDGDTHTLNAASSSGVLGFQVNSTDKLVISGSRHIITSSYHADNYHITHEDGVQIRTRNTSGNAGSGVGLSFMGHDGGSYHLGANIQCRRLSSTSSDDSMDMRFGIKSGTSMSELIRLRPNTVHLGGAVTSTLPTSDPVQVFIQEGGSNTFAAMVIETGGNSGGNRDYIRFYNYQHNLAGKIAHNGSTTVSYTTSSDYRLKENVVDLPNGITRVKQLQPRRFNWIGEPDVVVDGFVAHEAQTVVPEAVTGTKDEVEVWHEGDELPDGVSVGDVKPDEDGNPVPIHQGIDHGKLVPLLTAALQEAITKIETLETKVAALEGGE